MNPRLLLATSLALVAVPLAGAPAGAAKDVDADAAGDVVQLADVDQAAPDISVGDVTRFTTDHRKRFLLLTTTLAEVPTSGWFFETWSVRTPKRTYTYTLHLSDPVAGRPALRGSAQPQCAGLLTELRPAQHAVVARVPRSCLGNPAWVRTGTGVSVVVDDVQYVDDARVDGAPDVYAIKLGPKVRVG